MDGVAVTALAARPAGDVPGISSTAVAVLTDHVRLAGALAAEPLTLTLLWGCAGLRYRAQRVTHTLCREEDRC